MQILQSAISALSLFSLALPITGEQLLSSPTSKEKETGLAQSRWGKQPPQKRLHRGHGLRGTGKLEKLAPNQSSVQRFPAMAVAQKIEKGGDLGTQKTLSNETEEGLGA